MSPPLPTHTGTFDMVLIVGAPSDGQVPCNAIPELLCVTKPGEEQPSQAPPIPITIHLPLCTAQTQAPESLRLSEGQRSAHRHIQPSLTSQPPTADPRKQAGQTGGQLGSYPWATRSNSTLPCSLHFLARKPGGINATIPSP